MVRTRSEKVDRIRKTILELLLAHAPDSPQLQELGREYGADRDRFEKDASFCIDCGLCVRYCSEVKKKNAVGFVDRGIRKEISFIPEIASSECNGCKECFPLCPTIVSSGGFRPCRSPRISIGFCKTSVRGGLKKENAMAVRAQAVPLSGVKLRRLTAQDLDAVVEIDAQITGRSRRAYLERRLQAALRAPALHTQFAAEENGVLEGYVLARKLEGEFGRVKPALRLEVIGVRPGEQGHGYGDALLGALEADGRKHDIFELGTQAGWKDHGVLGLLDHAGFELGTNQILDCEVHRGRIGSGDAEKVLAPEHHRFSAEIDYGEPQANDFEALARDRADVRSLERADLDEIVRIDRRIMERDRSAYISHIVDEAMHDFAIFASRSWRTRMDLPPATSWPESTSAITGALSRWPFSIPSASIRASPAPASAPHCYRSCSSTSRRCGSSASRPWSSAVTLD